MEKIYEVLRGKYNDLNDLAKDGICEWMKKLGHIEFNSGRSFPFTNIDGEYESVIVYEMRYDEETGDVIAYSETFREWSIQEDGTVDGCIELLYYIEEEAFKKVVADFVHLVLEEEKDLNEKCQSEKMDVITDQEMFDLFARTFKGKDVDTSNEDELYETAQCIFSESCNKIESVIPWLKDGESDGESTWYDQYHDEIVSLYCSILKDEVRRCDNCGKLMKEGYYLGGEFACSDECCLALYGGDKQQMEEDLSHAEEDDGECYWTEWESYYFED